MFERFRRPRDGEPTAGSVAVEERDERWREHPIGRPEAPTGDDDRRFERTAADVDRDRDANLGEPEPRPPIVDRGDMVAVRARQRDRFGGINWGSAFFGWLSAVGLASILTALLAGAGVALGLFEGGTTDTSTAEDIGFGGGVALLVVLSIAWYCGGYVAGRMSRFDGARQGAAVWLWSLLAAIVVGATAAIGGSEYNVLDRLNLPSIPIGDDTLTTAGAIAAGAALLATLLFAVLGGKFGERFHRRVDRVATREYVGEH